MCRMCLVEIEGGRGYPPACTTPVADGMVVHSQNDAVKQIQDGVLEFLLINHPLDCPVCDRGGECPLQDQTLAFGPGESRFVEEKRHFPKPIPLSELVLLDRERCIQCARCIRFADEIAGDTLIDFIDRGDRMQVLNFEEQPFDSYFSGNTVQICPVGALTASQYRFRARPWDLSTVETSCTTCSVQCRGAVQSSSNRLVRLARRRLRAREPRLALRQGSLRSRVDPLRSPRARAAGARRRHAPRGVVARRARPRRRRDREGQGPARRRVDRGPRRRARHQRRRVRVVGARQGRHRDRQRRRAARRRSARRLRARHGPRRDRRPRFARARSSSSITTCAIRCRCCSCACAGRCSSSVSRSSTSRPSRTRCRRTRPSVVAHRSRRTARRDRARRDHAGDRRAAPARSSSSSGAATSRHRPSRSSARPPSSPGVHDVLFLSALRRGNVHGALDAGLAPGFLPGRVTLDDGRDWFTERWGAVPAERGLDAEGILRAAADGKIRVLVLARRRSRSATSPTPRSRAARSTRSTRSSWSTASTPSRRPAPTCSCPATLVGREGGHGHQPRRPGATRRAQGRARRHRHGRLADRGRARAPPRPRPRPRDRRRGHRTRSPRRARVRRRDAPSR